MRFAFAPTSLSPTRETLRTSTRLPAPSGRTRTTMSSLKPNQRVVSRRLDAPGRRVARDDLPSARARRVDGALHRLLRRRLEDRGLDVGIGLLLLLRDLHAAVRRAVGRLLPLGEQRHERGRIESVGGDVVDRGRALRVLQQDERGHRGGDREAQRDDRHPGPMAPTRHGHQHDENEGAHARSEPRVRRPREQREAGLPGPQAHTRARTRGEEHHEGRHGEGHDQGPRGVVACGMASGGDGPCPLEPHAHAEARGRISALRLRGSSAPRCGCAPAPSPRTSFTPGRRRAMCRARSSLR